MSLLMSEGMIARNDSRWVPDARRNCTLANSGSVGLPYDGDPRAFYLLIEGPRIEIRRVEYDVHRELEALSHCGLPHADWVARILKSGSPQNL